MATIFLSKPLFYKNGESGFSSVIGFEGKTRRVVRYAIESPFMGANKIDITLYTGGKGAGSHIPLRFFIGTDPESHANAGSEYEYTGELIMGSDNRTFTGSADYILIPSTTYYLWIFPAEDTLGWYWGTRANYTSVLTTYGSATSIIDGSDGELGEEHEIKITRYIEDLIDNISATCGNDTLVIATGSKLESLFWTPPIEWSSKNTVGTTVPVLLTCITYDGETEVGRTEKELVFYIPDSVVPEITINVEEPNGHLQKYGVFVRGKSIARVSIGAIGAYGSEILEYSTTFEDKTKSGNQTEFELENVGTIPIFATVVDSRGRTASIETNIVVFDYKPPTVTILSAYRSDSNGNQDDDGTYATISFKANIISLNEKNSANYMAKYRIKGKSEWNEDEVENHSGEFSPDGATHIVPIEVDFAYELCIVAMDDFSSVESIYRTVQVAFFLISVHKETKSVGIGQKATENGLCAFGIPAKFNAGILFDGKNLFLEYNSSINAYVLTEREE